MYFSTPQEEIESLRAERDALRAELTACKAKVILQSDHLKSTTDIYEVIRRDELAALRARCAAMRTALENLKHVDGCYCEASFSGPGCHPRHSPECVSATRALTGPFPPVVKREVLEETFKALVGLSNDPKAYVDNVIASARAELERTK